ncbi:MULTISPECIES: CPXCG motif-containing cysteine-rich protein [Vibrio]|uniref:CPXCG motif-containing cysteine-rich protein n=1 Tax=Vibrio algicola TaxID=2662262 RepID=A0A5Q0TGB1_9VIBR|nr:MULTISPECIES: CPXCG motif-containing cysteine-rich protein [Vibrio]MBD1575585.1 CPXCG motif-containing cysteine-rich protein [Vibrio sp. S11_S32]
MIKYTEKKVSCPHCGNLIRLTIDAANGDQNFYDDCPTCNHAVHLELKVDANTANVHLTIGDEDHSFF